MVFVRSSFYKVIVLESGFSTSAISTVSFLWAVVSSEVMSGPRYSLKFLLDVGIILQEGMVLCLYLQSSGCTWRRTGMRRL